MIHVKEVLTDEMVSTAVSNTHHFARLLRMAAAYPIPEKRIPPVPTMLLWGANDLEVPVEEAQHIQQQIPGTKLSEIEDCGHFPQLETPEVFAWQVMQFLSELDRPRKPMGGVGMLPQSPDD
jgi:pimeloyl-ACP methyl ester carboxylesterase